MQPWLQINVYPHTKRDRSTVVALVARGYGPRASKTVYETRWGVPIPPTEFTALVTAVMDAVREVEEGETSPSA